MTAHTPANATPLEQARALYRLLDERDQLALLCDLIQGGDGNLSRSDDFIDALIPVDSAFDEAFADLENAADDAQYEGLHPDLLAQSFGLELPTMSIFGAVR